MTAKRNGGPGDAVQVDTLTAARVAHAPVPITAIPIDGGSAFRAAMRQLARPQASRWP